MLSVKRNFLKTISLILGWIAFDTDTFIETVRNRIDKFVKHVWLNLAPFVHQQVHQVLFVFRMMFSQPPFQFIRGRGKSQIVTSFDKFLIADFLF